MENMITEVALQANEYFSDPLRGRQRLYKNKLLSVQPNILTQIGSLNIYCLKDFFFLQYNFKDRCHSMDAGLF